MSIELIEDFEPGEDDKPGQMVYFVRIKNDETQTGFDGPIMSTPREAFDAFGIMGGYAYKFPAFAF